MSAKTKFFPRKAEGCGEITGQGGGLTQWAQTIQAGAGVEESGEGEDGEEEERGGEREEGRGRGRGVEGEGGRGWGQGGRLEIP